MTRDLKTWPIPFLICSNPLQKIVKVLAMWGILPDDASPAATNINLFSTPNEILSGLFRSKITRFR